MQTICPKPAKRVSKAIASMILVITVITVMNSIAVAVIANLINIKTNTNIVVAVLLPLPVL